MVRTIEKADALAAMNMEDVCHICAAMEKKKAFAVYFFPLRQGGEVGTHFLKIICIVNAGSAHHLWQTLETCRLAGRREDMYWET